MLHTQNHVRIAVVIPTYKARASILDVVAMIGPEVSAIYVIDDACPEGSGLFAEEHCFDARLKVKILLKNRGVGGATLIGYEWAAEEGNDIIVKIDSDAQMDPSILYNFVKPIIDGRADYTKGNRFFNAHSFSSMPKARVFGNVGLSLLTKLSTGYWKIMDPTNGYTALHAKIVKYLPCDQISERFFFETDMLFFLGLMGAVVVDIPMVAHYGDEKSNLRIRQVLSEFSTKHLHRCVRRIILSYVVRNFSFASLYLIAGVPLFCFGSIYGIFNWMRSYMESASTPAGTIALAGICIVLGVQFLISFLQYDVVNEASVPLNLLLEQRVVYPLHQFVRE